MKNHILFLFLLLALGCQSRIEMVETTNEFGRRVRFEKRKSDQARHGIYERYYGSGIKAEEAFYQNDSLHGTQSFFYETGKLEMLQEFKHGVPDGHYRKFFEDGQIEIEQEFVAGAMQGKSVRYYPNGEKMEEVMIVNNEENGPFSEYYPNGTLKTQGNYTFIEDGAVEQGELKEFDSTGVLVRIADCEAGICRTKWRKE